MPQPDYFIREGDAGEAITATLEDSAGDPVNLTGATVEFVMRPIGGGAGTVSAAASVVTPSEGAVSYTWQSADTDTPGWYLGSWVVTFSGGEQQTFPNAGFTLIEVTPAADTAVTYITAEQLKASGELTGTTFADQDVRSAVASASRAIEKYARRCFWLDADAEQVRYYSPDRSMWQQIDDLVVLTALATDPVGDGSFADAWTLNSDFLLTPLNAPADDEPWTAIEVHPSGRFSLPTSFPRSIRVTGQFGWATVPDQVVTATTILATKLVKRMREAPFGVVAFGIDGTAIRIARTDPDVYNLIGPFRRHAIAVA